MAEAPADAAARMIRFLDVHAALVQSLSLEGRVSVMISSRIRCMQALALPPAFGPARRDSVFLDLHRLLKGHENVMSFSLNMSARQ